jgi:hypothetical protein
VADWMAGLHFSCEMSLPIRIDRLIGSTIGLEVKC